MADTWQQDALKIDDSLLQDIGLGSLPQQEKTNLIKQIYETLEMRVGVRLADQMTNDQLDEFEGYFNAQDDAGAFQWLETNFPNYKVIVADEFAKLKKEVALAHLRVTANVFISYSRKDGDVVEPLVQDFQSVGITVWVDHDHLMPGTSDWEREIRQSIVKADGVVYIASEDAAASQYVRDELAIAREEGIPVLPLWVRGDKWMRCIPLGWGHTHYADARGDKYTIGVLQLIASLKKANGGA